MKGWFVLLPLLLAGCAPGYKPDGITGARKPAS